MAWLNSAWKKRKSITIAGTADGAQVNYQMKVTIHRSAGADAGADVYVDVGGCQADYDDIRFTRSDGTTLLDYWIESFDANTAVVWVEFNSIPIAPGTGTFYIYYGNPAAAAVSNGDNTFGLLFDDFNDNVIDAAKWTESNVGVGTNSESSQRLKQDITTPAAAARARLDSAGKKTFAGNFDLRVDFLNVSVPNQHVQGVVQVNDGTYWVGCDRRNGYGGGNREMFEASVGGGFVFTPVALSPASGKFRITRVGTTHKSYYWDGANWVNVRTDVGATGAFYVIFALSNDASTLVNCHIDWDNLFVRNFTTNEPTWSAWGGEEGYGVRSRMMMGVGC